MQWMLEKTKDVVKKTMFILVSCDEATITYCMSWVSIHKYVMHDWQHIARRNAGIVNSLMEHGGMAENEITSKLICLQIVYLCFGGFNLV